MRDPDSPDKYSALEQDGLPPSVVAYLASPQSPSGISLLSGGVMFSAFALCIIVPFGINSILVALRTGMFGSMLWNGAPALLVSEQNFGSALIMMSAGIFLSPWIAHIFAWPIRGCTESLAVWALNDGLSRKYGGLARSVNRRILRRVPECFSADPPRFLRAFTWRLAGVFGRLGLALSAVALLFFYFDINNMTVVTRSALHHSSYFSTRFVQHDLGDVKYIETGCAYSDGGGGDEFLMLEYRLAFGDGTVFNLANMRALKGRTIAVLESLDQQLIQAGAEVRRAKFLRGRREGAPMNDPECPSELAERNPPPQVQRWIKLLRLHTDLT